MSVEQSQNNAPSLTLSDSSTQSEPSAIPQVLIGKKIVLGISGGIAAYKCADLTRRLIERGAQVRVVMTASAKEFITPLTMQAVSGHTVSDSLFDPAAEASMGHIELAKWADLLIIAPATADIIARIRAGMGNDLLSTLVLATDAPVAIAPAMNQQMYANVATQENIRVLKSRQFQVWGPGSGQQACGDIGSGRMLEPMEIIEHCRLFLSSDRLSNCAVTSPNLSTVPTQTGQPNYALHGLSITVTAGPTREAIDPVRFISNHSSGKMGFAIAQVAQSMGADVTIISGPVALNTPEGVQRINVESAEQMHQEALKQAVTSQIFISCAAVADYRPAKIETQKIKKTDDNQEMQITMIKNPDIVASIAALKVNRPFTVGFAAETEHIERYARNKLQKKNLDLICANDVSQAGLGFNSDNNALHLYWNEGEQKLAITSKLELAHQMLTLIAKQVKRTG